MSQDQVIEASRAFICVRVATYEDKREADFTRRLYSRSFRPLENTTFAILAPDAKTLLVEAVRSPKWHFRNAEKMAQAMNKIARRYEDRPRPSAEKSPLPTAASVRLGINIAAGDNLPLVVVYAENKRALDRLTTRIRKLAWSEEFLGKLIYSETIEPEDLAPVEGIKLTPGVYVVQPDTFGMNAEVLSQVQAGESGDALVRCLQAGIEAHKQFPKTMMSHMRAGQKEGVFWTPTLEVTDRMEAAARAQTKQRIEVLDK